MSNAQWVEVAILVACLLASGVAAAAHTSLLQFHRSRLRHLAQQAGVFPPSLGLLREPASLVPLLGTVHTLALLGAAISAMLLAGHPGQCGPGADCTWSGAPGHHDGGCPGGPTGGPSAGGEMA